MIYSYTCRPLPCSTHIRETSSVSRWKLTQKPTHLDNSVSLSPKLYIFNKPLSSWLKEICKKGGRKIIKS